jgi:uncharacterized protein YgbK (DUF1537 family)
MSQPMLTILADDLTGACDTGAMFTGRGPVCVTVFPQARAAGDVAVIDSESRALDEARARARVRAAVRESPAAGGWFKKIDSTLRGAVADEVDELIQASGAPGAVLCPAFPAQGRTLVGRILRVHGTPVQQTALAGDPDFRLGDADVVAALRSRVERPVGWCSRGELGRGGMRVAPGAILVCDAATDADLAAIVASVLALPAPPILAGAAGLARALARHLGLLGAAPRLPERARWLIVAGTRHPATSAQVEALRPHGVRVLRSPAEPQADRAAVAADLARQTRKVLEHEPIDAVAVTGGDTAVALCRELEVERLELLGAPEPGLALGRLRWGNDRELTLLTKAGGFGPPDLLLRLLA